MERRRNRGARKAIAVSLASWAACVVIVGTAGKDRANSAGRAETYREGSSGFSLPGALDMSTFEAFR
jgi:hypothetical protein